MKEKVLNLKEFVIVLLLACVETAIGLVTAMPFAANLQLVYFLAPGLAGLINGIIYVLLVKSARKSVRSLSFRWFTACISFLPAVSMCSCSSQSLLL